MKDLNLKSKDARKAIDDADYIVVGAGAGLSESAGISYGGQRFKDNFPEFIAKYGMQDMYSATFYPFETPEEKWGYLAKHVLLNRYSVGKTKVYEQLFDLVKDKQNYVITTNVDHQFNYAGFRDKDVFPVQGDYGFFQCELGCHNKLYDNEIAIKEMVSETHDCKIPTELIPTCPVCGKQMDLNIRKNSFFVEDDAWHKHNEEYNDFISNITNEKVVYLELGVGYNTPMIIRYPFEQFTYNNPNATLIRINRDFSNPIKENEDKTISFYEDIGHVFNYLL